MKRTVLVVEDDGPTRDMLRDVLVLDSFDVATAGGSADALRVASAVGPDIVLIDLMLHPRSGIETAAELRESGFPDTPMIAMSSSPLMLQYAADHDLFQACLDKPIDLDELLFRIDELVDAGEAEPE